MNKHLKTLDELFAAIIIWPVLIAGVFKIVIEIFHFPVEWDTIVLMFFLVLYLGIKVGIGERI